MTHALNEQRVDAAGDTRPRRIYGHTESASSSSSSLAIITKEGHHESFSRVKILRITRNSKTGSSIQTVEESMISEAQETGQFAFVLQKTVYDNFADEEDMSQIDIVNPDLWELLKENLGDYPNHLFRGSPITLHSPYETIVFGWDALQKASNEEPKSEADEQAREDLKTLLKVLSSGSSGDSKLDKHFRARELSRPDQIVQFDDLWTIFPPGTLVYGRPFQDQDQVFLVQNIVDPWPAVGERGQRSTPWELSCWTYDQNGDGYQRTAFTLVFEPFEGHKLIRDLQYYPLRLHDEYDKVRQELIQRGKIFRKLCTARDGSRLFEYDGDAIISRKGLSGLAPDDNVCGPLFLAYLVPNSQDLSE